MSVCGVKWKLLFLLIMSLKIQPAQRLKDLGHQHQLTPWLPVPGSRVTDCHLISCPRNIPSHRRLLRSEIFEVSFANLIGAFQHINCTENKKIKINDKAREGVNLLLSAVKLYWRQVMVTQGFFTLNCSLNFILLSTALFFGFFFFIFSTKFVIPLKMFMYLLLNQI